MILSIIIPVYNVEPFVEKCIRSCEAQDVPKDDYEIVVVNDGSNVPTLRMVDNSQYPLFAFRPDLISNKNWFWLRDVVSNTSFARVAADGPAAWVYASDPTGVRPAFSIC